MYISTQTFEIGNKAYCSYCGKEAEEEWSWHNHRPDKKYFYCECKDAKKESDFYKEIERIKQKAENEIRELKRMLPEVNQEMINQRQYEFELDMLKKKYKAK
ncbi:hypothetical protein QO179_23625 [Bacillus stercoris]|nr:hypothetical protein [Bacillus stercoris]